MSEAPGLDLGRPRDVSGLVRESLRLYARHLPTFLAISVAIVVPVEVVVLGFGLEQLEGGYDTSTNTPEQVIPLLTSFLVTTPLMTACTIHAVRTAARGDRPRAGDSLLAGLEAFTPLFVALLIAGAGILLGLIALIVPGIYLLVRWFFVPQAVVVDGRTLLDALRRSAELVQGAWWRTFGVIVLANLIAVVPGLLIVLPVTTIADGVDSEAIALAGAMAADAVTGPFIALIATLLFFDLRARRERGVT